MNSKLEVAKVSELAEEAEERAAKEILEAKAVERQAVEGAALERYMRRKQTQEPMKPESNLHKKKVRLCFNSQMRLRQIWRSSVWKWTIRPSGTRILPNTT